MPGTLNDLHGLLAIDKPAGITSAAVVGRIKHLINRRAKVGHAGTLDSFATGVLVLLIGSATKRCEELMASPKQYETTVRLGASTETLDPLMPPLDWPGAIEPSRDSVLAALAQQTGEILQTPPLYSALKVDGRRASDRTRAGEALVLPPRPVRIDSIELLDYTWPDLRLRIDCGRGTYVRAIARDIGNFLSTGGYLTQLRRTRVGDVRIADAVAPDGLTEDELIRRLRD